jgi:hypothetical protein
MIVAREDIAARLDELARKYVELARMYSETPRRQENRRRALRIGPGAKQAEKRVIALNPGPCAVVKPGDGIEGSLVLLLNPPPTEEKSPLAGFVILRYRLTVKRTTSGGACLTFPTLFLTLTSALVTHSATVGP